MNIEDYQSGEYIIQHQGEKCEYRSFLPSLINNDWNCSDAETNYLIAEAMQALGNLNSHSRQIPNVDVYIKMHIQTEANMSSRIEGTETTIEEDLLPIEDIDPEKRDDYEEVKNYVKAITWGIEQIQSPKGLPLCNRLLRSIHAILLEGVRGKYKTPGEFRKSQNWIGGANINSALYVPPSELDLPILMNDFEQFINQNQPFTIPIVKIAILHYQFETIHPFLDGNGRIGRLMVPLFLLSKKILTKPCFYISSYLEKNRTEYYDALQRTRKNSDLLGWLKFFLNATIYTANAAIDKFENVIDYVSKINEYVKHLNKKNTGNIDLILQSFFNQPVWEATHLANSVGLSTTAVNKILQDLLTDRIVTEITGFCRNRVYCMQDYMLLFKDKTDNIPSIISR